SARMAPYRSGRQRWQRHRRRLVAARRDQHGRAMGAVGQLTDPFPIAKTTGASRANQILCPAMIRAATRARRSEEALHGREQRLSMDGAAYAATPEAAPFESRRHTSRQNPDTQRVFGPYTANLYHLFTNLSADCAPSRARRLACHSRC